MIKQTGAHWYSERASFSCIDNTYIPDLLLLPYTEEAVKYLSQRIVQVQDLLGERMLIENVSAYIACVDNCMSEAEFLTAVVSEADCYLLLDINNVMVSCYNLNQSPKHFFANIPVERVKEIHLAGYDNRGGYLLDAHNQTVSDDVWEQYRLFVNDLPELDTLLLKQKKTQQMLDVCERYRHKVCV